MLVHCPVSEGLVGPAKQAGMPEDSNITQIDKGTVYKFDIWSTLNQSQLNVPHMRVYLGQGWAKCILQAKSSLPGTFIHPMAPTNKLCPTQTFHS